jgi:hypothetical protein
MFCGSVFLPKRVTQTGDLNGAQLVADFYRAAIQHLGKNAKIAMAKMRPHKPHIIIWVTPCRSRVDIDRGAPANGFFYQQQCVTAA